jgi:hypothetical protein
MPETNTKGDLISKQIVPQTITPGVWRRSTNSRFRLSPRYRRIPTAAICPQTKSLFGIEDNIFS